MSVSQLVRSVKFCLFPMCVALFLAGCGKAPKGPEFVEVQGKVTVDGAPMKGLIVGFSPDRSKKTTGPMSIGETDAEGVFKLVGPSGRKGAVVGFHNVTVTCPMVGSTLESGPQTPTTPCNLPETYADLQQSGLTAEVKASGSPIVFELKSKP